MTRRRYQRKNPDIRRTGVVIGILAFLLTGSAPAQEAVKAFSEPYRRIEVAAQEIGMLARVPVTEGQLVSRGQLLGELASDELEAELQIALAAAQAQGKLNSSLAELRLQDDRLSRLLGLRERGHASQQEVDRARMQKEIAEAKVQTATEELGIKRLEVERIEAQLEKRRLRSPIDGIVTRVYREAGEFISVNDPSVFQVVQLNPLRVEFMVPVANLAGIEPEQTINVLLEGDVKVIGVVEFVSPTIDAESDRIRVKVRLPNPDGILKGGTMCLLLIPSDSDGNSSGGQNRRRSFE